MSVVLMAGSCDVEEDPDAEPFMAVLEDCAIEETGPNSGFETCIVSSADQRVEGSWEFRFVVEKEEGISVYQGDMSISTVSGDWQGTGERVVTDSGSWKGGGNLIGAGSHEGYEMMFGGEEDSFDEGFRVSGTIAPKD